MACVHAKFPKEYQQSLEIGPRGAELEGVKLFAVTWNDGKFDPKTNKFIHKTLLIPVTRHIIENDVGESVLMTDVRKLFSYRYRDRKLCSSTLRGRKKSTCIITIAKDQKV